MQEVHDACQYTRQDTRRRLVAVAVLIGLFFTVGWLSPGKDEFYIFRNMTGKDLPPGQILAEEGQKGVTRNIHAQGWYFYNRLTHSAEASKVTDVGTDQVCILKQESGDPLPEGRILAPVRRQVDGTIIKNAMGLPESQCKGEIAVKVEAGSIGVVTARTGTSTPAGQLLAKEGQRGVQEKVLSPGTYYLNPEMYKVDLVSIQSQIAEFLDDKGTVPQPHADVIDFPSNDGFHIKIDVAVEWRVNTDQVAEVFTRLGNIKDIEAAVRVWPCTNSPGAWRPIPASSGCRPMRARSGAARLTTCKNGWSSGSVPRSRSRNPSRLE